MRLMVTAAMKDSLMHRLALKRHLKEFKRHLKELPGHCHRHHQEVAGFLVHRHRHHHCHHLAGFLWHHHRRHL